MLDIMRGYVNMRTIGKNFSVLQFSNAEQGFYTNII